MGDLDSKLEQAFINAGICNGERIPDAHELRTSLLPLVKRAIIDAGWKKHDKAGCVQFDLGEEQKAVLMAKVTEVMMFREPVMTGQEWYDRFIEEIEKDAKLPDSRYYRALSGTERVVYMVDFVSDQLDKAAKKAAGIE